MSASSRPVGIRLRRVSRLLELDYEDGSTHALSWEFLRVHSPSAEVRGHHEAQATLQTGKCNVALVEVRPAGHYALQLIFDDGHDSGLYTWDYLRHLGAHQEQLWARYLEALAAAGASRDPDTQVVQIQP